MCKAEPPAPAARAVISSFMDAHRVIRPSDEAPERT